MITHTILIADDDPTLRAVAREILARARTVSWRLQMASGPLLRIAAAFGATETTAKPLRLDNFVATIGRILANITPASA